MIFLKRIKLTRKNISFGLLGVLVALVIQPNMRGIIIGFVGTEYAHWQMAKLNPQNENELWKANNQAIEMDLRYASVFSGQGYRYVDAWVKNPDGSMKAWVDTTQARFIAQSLSHGTNTESYYPPEFRSASTADFNWRYHRGEIWREGGLTVLAGAVAVAMGFYLLYFLIIGLVGYILVIGKVGNNYTPIIDQEPTIQELHTGGDDATHVDHQPADVPLSLVWVVVLSLVAISVLTDWRKAWTRIMTVTSRAPPSLKGAVS